MRGALLARAVPESEYAMEKKKAQSKELDEYVKAYTSPEFRHQQIVTGEATHPVAKVKQHAKVDVKQKEAEKPLEVKPKKTRKAKAKVTEPVETKAEEKAEAKVHSEKKSSHNENLKKVQALRKEKGISLADAWALFKK